MVDLHRSDLKTLWLLGRPVGHSLSPLIQNTALAFMGEPAVYLAANVEEENVASAIRGLMALGALGANVTVPHKEAAFRYCDILSDRARAMGACNFLKFQDGQVYGDNTDGDGWLQGLGAELGSQLPRKALVIGAGGAARAVVFSLACHGVGEIVVLNRSLDRAQSLARNFSAYQLSRVYAAPLERFLEYLDDSCLVVQTTSVGLEGEDCPVEIPQRWPSGAILSELIYSRETALLRAVREQGEMAFDGLSMLVYQAAESLSLWLDKPIEKIPVELMLTAARSVGGLGR